MNSTSTNKILRWISLSIYVLAFLGLVSIVFEAPEEQPLRFQYRNISPNGLARTIVDYVQLGALLMIILSAVKGFQINKTLVFASFIIYSIFILPDVNTWVFFTNEDFIYWIIIAIEASPLVLFVYQLHIFRKEYRGIFMVGIIALLAGFLSHYFFYKTAVARGFRGGFYYDYPTLMKLMGWFCFMGALFTIVSVMEAIRYYREVRKEKELTIYASQEE